jgi:hypothetical protein
MKKTMKKKMLPFVGFVGGLVFGYSLKRNLNYLHCLKKDINYNKIFSKEEIKEYRERMLPDFIKSDKKLSNVNIKDYKLKEKIGGGFYSYRVLLYISNLNSDSLELIKNEFKDLLEGLEEDKIYSTLVSVISDKDSKTILPRAIFIHKESSVVELAHLVVNRLRIYEGKYDHEDCYSLVVSGRV